jgi:hypothetical protein
MGMMLKTINIYIYRTKKVGYKSNKRVEMWKIMRKLTGNNMRQEKIWVYMGVTWAWFILL